jgi:hypothetical protein
MGTLDESPGKRRKSFWPAQNRFPGMPFDFI